MIYLDSAATSFYRPPQVADAVRDAVISFGNSARGSYETALESSRVIFDTRCLVDELFDGFGPEQTVFTMNATESLNMAIKGLIRPGERVVTTVMEHNSVLRPLWELECAGAKVEYVGLLAGCERQALLDLDALHRAITPGTRAVVLTHASNLTGNVLDLTTIGAWCQEAGCLFVVDASQTAGHVGISMKDMKIDVLCFTGHKGLLGPQGTGGLCVKKGLEIRPLVTGGSGIQTFSRSHPSVMPTALEAGTLNGHGLAGLRAALLWLREQGVEKLHKKELEQARLFYQGLSDLQDVTFYGDYRCFEGSARAALVTLNIGDEDSALVSDLLDQDYQIAVRAGGHCAPRIHEALETREQGAVRFSFSPFNTAEQTKEAVQAVREIAKNTCGK